MLSRKTTKKRAAAPTFICLTLLLAFPWLRLRCRSSCDQGPIRCEHMLTWPHRQPITAHLRVQGEPRGLGEHRGVGRRLAAAADAVVVILPGPERGGSRGRHAGHGHVSRVTCHVTSSSSRRIQGDTDSSGGRSPGSGCSVLGVLDTALMWSLTGDNIWNNLKHTHTAPAAAQLVFLTMTKYWPDFYHTLQ